VFYDRAVVVVIVVFYAKNCDIFIYCVGVIAVNMMKVQTDTFSFANAASPCISIF